MGVVVVVVAIHHIMASNKKRLVTDPVEARVELINGNFDLPKESVDAMRTVRSVISEAAKKLRVAVEAAPKHDKGRLIAALDSLQHAKDTACVSLILPFASKDDDD